MVTVSDLVPPAVSARATQFLQKQIGLPDKLVLRPRSRGSGCRAMTDGGEESYASNQTTIRLTRRREASPCRCSRDCRGRREAEPCPTRWHSCADRLPCRHTRNPPT